MLVQSSGSSPSCAALLLHFPAKGAFFSWFLPAPVARLMSAGGEGYNKGRHRVALASCSKLSSSHASPVAKTHIPARLPHFLPHLQLSCRSHLTTVKGLKQPLALD